MIGGGIIGLEMASVYEALGSKVTVVELTDQLIPGCDPDLVKPLAKRVGDRYEAIHLNTKVASAEAGDDGIKVSFEGDDAPDDATFDRVLVAVGRRANGDLLDLEATGVEVDDRGEIHGRPRPPNQRLAHLRDRRHHRRADARPQGDPRGQGRRRAHRRSRRRLRAARDPVRRLHGPRGRLVRPDRDRGQGAGHRVREGGLPVAGLGPRALARPRRGPDEAPDRARNRTRSSAPASSAPTRAT